MWWKEPVFENVFPDKQGKKWHFRIWHGHPDGQYIQRIFFWSENKSQTGLLEFKDDQTLHRTKLKDKIIKLVNNAEYRQRFLKELNFPIEENYYNYFPID